MRSTKKSCNNCKEKSCNNKSKSCNKIGGNAFLKSFAPLAKQLGTQLGTQAINSAADIVSYSINGVNKHSKNQVDNALQPQKYPQGGNYKGNDENDYDYANAPLILVSDAQSFSGGKKSKKSVKRKKSKKSVKRKKSKKSVRRKKSKKSVKRKKSKKSVNRKKSKKSVKRKKSKKSVRRKKSKKSVRRKKSKKSVKMKKSKKSVNRKKSKKEKRCKDMSFSSSGMINQNDSLRDLLENDEATLLQSAPVIPITIKQPHFNDIKYGNKTI